ncbi:MAG: 30S ribosomal protein S8 [Kiritimatiellae bacterium]|nr:30S ribosomal protein S8 [Kiritimatiellia bacterium]
MNQTDPIGDMLTRLRNATMARADSVELPYSRMKDSIARILKREGFIQDYTAEGGGHDKILRLYVKFGPGHESVIRGLRRVSKPGLRRYIGADALQPIKSGTGVAIVSTSRGLMTDREARQQNTGGEWLCTIW